MGQPSDTDTSNLAQRLDQLSTVLPELSSQILKTQTACDATMRELSAAALEAMLNTGLGLGHRATLATLIRWREARARFIPGGWFSDPAWDILLRLYEAHLDHRELTVGDLGSFASTSSATTNRWLELLASRGWIERRRDERDQRRVFVSLAENGRKQMHHYFDAVSQPIG